MRKMTTTPRAKQVMGKLAKHMRVAYAHMRRCIVSKEVYDVHEHFVLIDGVLDVKNEYYAQLFINETMQETVNRMVSL